MRLAIGILLTVVSASAQFSIGPPTLPDSIRGSGYASTNPSGCRISTSVVSMTAAGGTAPFSFSVVAGALPPGLSLGSDGVFRGETVSAGSYSFVIRGSDSGGQTTTASYSVNIAPQPSCGPFPGTVGEPLSLPFGCSGNGESFTYSSPAGALPPGLTIDPISGNIVGAPTQAGQYSFDWRCAGTTIFVTGTVSMTITGPAQAPPPATAKPSSISLIAPAQGSGLVASAIALDSGVDAGYQAAAITDSGGAWLSVTPASGTVTAGQTTTLSVRADASALAAGSYVGRIEIQPAGDSLISIPVTLSKARLDKQLQLTQSGVTITVEEGSPPLTRGFFDVVNTGSGTIDWTAAATTQSGGNWLEPTQTSGNTGQSQSSFGQGAIVNPSGLTPGAYYGSIQIAAADAANSPQQATVVLNVRPRGVAVTPLVQPRGAVVLGQEGSNGTVLRYFNVSNSSSAALTFTLSSTTEDGGAWLPSGQGSILPAGGGAPIDVTSGQQVSVPAGGSVSVAPLVRSDGLARGVYRGLATLSFSNGTTANIRIVLVVTPPRTALTLEGGAEQAGGCTPNQTVPVVTELGGGGPPASGWAQPISVQVVDDCGNPVNSGSATTTYSGVSSPQTPLTNLGGTWSGTWTPPPTGDDTDVEVTVTVTDADGNTGESSETVTVEANELAPPIVAEGGVVQAASFAREPLALGSIVSLFGSDLSPMKVESGGVGASALPLSTELGNTRITLGGEPLPLLFVREDQINAILPFELGDRAADDLPLVVERTDNQSLSTAQKISVSSARPGIFTQTGAGTGPGSILDQGFELVNVDNPTAAGDAIVVFATGLGPTDPPVATGAAAPSQEPLARATQEVRVTVDGIDARVLFAGLSPGFAGLFQVNIIVPDGVESGDAELVVYSGGQPSQTATVAVR